MDSLYLTDLGVLLKVLENLIAPVLVLGVFGEPVQVEETLHRLWSQEVMSVCKLSERVQTFQCKHLLNLDYSKTIAELLAVTFVDFLHFYWRTFY